MCRCLALLAAGLIVNATTVFGFQVPQQEDVVPSQSGPAFEGQSVDVSPVSSANSNPSMPGSGADTYLQQGLAEATNKNIDVAIANFTECLRLDPRNQLAYYHRGLMYEQLSPPNHTRALGDQTEAIRLQPRGVDSYLARARVYKLTGSLEQSRADYNSVLIRDPKNADARKELAALSSPTVDPWAALTKAQEDAKNAQTDARNAQTDAKNAQTDARNAQTDAKNAQTDARNAQTDARNAQTDARNAQTDAKNAQAALAAEIVKNKAPLNQANASAAIAEAKARTGLYAASIEESEARVQEAKLRAAKAKEEAKKHNP